MQSIFIDKGTEPTKGDLTKALGSTFGLWEAIAAYTKQQYPQTKEAWNYSSPKYGWSYRISDKKKGADLPASARWFF